MVWFFWMVYDTTVPTSDPLAEQVHNIGLMQNRPINPPRTKAHRWLLPAG
jgi:hypothetical protein